MRLVDRARPGVVRSLLAALALILIAGTAACGSDSEATGSGQRGPSTATVGNLDPVPIGPAPTPVLPVTVRSFDGTEVTVTSAERIIAADRYGTLAQTVWALGLGPNLIGRSTSAAFPAVQNLPNVTGGSGSLNVESILALRPTVFLTDTTSAAPAVREQLRAAGVTVVYFDPQRTMDGVAPQIEAVAAALGVPQRGQELAKRTRDEIAAASAAVPAQDKPLRIAFLYLRSTAITMMAGPGSGADSLITAIGGEDAGTVAGLTEPFTAITSEAMIGAAPDVLLVMTDGLSSVGGVDGLLKVPGIAQTPAGKNKRVVDMSDAVLLSFGPNTGRVVAALNEAVYGAKPA
ncbi:heme/hemin ABC transporter substrate-binding protein [Nocardia bhagyanarayanae]|uniref:Iron complex transport system substrate-binding protein n=1 Tax=Nocardia bhagyanarayanae TaxID=1215925 RepID=A0A543FG33_9NOCA|nr:ABC transporter substrate-binding protein [Nocardia bhagyanarayanae]TQM32828.1 iron complex transport system substrate-binding protein [Nocardia bhagyanarayanae]